jgi:hypothetical protein
MAYLKPPKRRQRLSHSFLSPLSSLSLFPVQIPWPQLQIHQYHSCWGRCHQTLVRRRNLVFVTVLQTLSKHLPGPLFACTSTLVFSPAIAVVHYPHFLVLSLQTRTASNSALNLPALPTPPISPDTSGYTVVEFLFLLDSGKHSVISQRGAFFGVARHGCRRGIFAGQSKLASALA